MMRISPRRKPLGLRPLVLLLVLGAAAVAQGQSESRQVAALGKIIPGEGVVNVAAPAGETGQAIVAEVSVTPGQTVKKGDPLAVLTTKPLLEAAVFAAQKSAAAAQADAAAAQAGIEVAQKQVAVFDHQLQSLDARVSAAQKEASAAQMGVDQAQKAIARAEAEYQAAVARLQGEIDEHTRLIKEWDPGTKDRVQIQSQQRILALEIKKLGSTKAAQDNELKSAYNTAQAQADAAAAQVDVVASERQSILDQKAIAEVQLAQVQAQADAAAAQAAAAQEQVRQAQARLATGTVFSPLNGVVVSVNAWPGTAVELGGVASVADTTEMFVEAEVYVDDVSKVKAGQAATVSGQPLGKELTGKVDRVGVQVAANAVFSRDPTAFADQRVVKVRIKLDDPAAVRSLIGAQVTVKIKP
ncbi:HlyD family efflux transporter periplasmic adaptor subunit [Ruficoccus amylovorans]|uniref:HlyD family efflux transporter periplasmic adaptor subunit n=1 Tax=Ruficoccus amylovorans TaxID=1804625 RepID=A0A842HGD4_9BACT|nr:HlyD family efflux transporter periplasmic adaptor subunit [Ruficoccus amylovorans]MBC2595349.1 HlyD family efflux transporter periplasmic adaptor subunit [Ruficoccus amylovorans]